MFVNLAKAKLLFDRGCTLEIYVDEVRDSPWWVVDNNFSTTMSFFPEFKQGRVTFEVDARDCKYIGYK